MAVTQAEERVRSLVLDIAEVNQKAAYINLSVVTALLVGLVFGILIGVLIVL